MSKKFKHPIAFIVTLAMVCSVLLYLPNGVMIDIGFGLSVSAATATTPSKPTVGDGSQQEPYEISNAAELYWFAGLVNGTLEDGTQQDTAANAVLTKNITVNSNLLSSLALDGQGNITGDTSELTSWMPIGKGKPYTGTFDGGNKTISGLYNNNDKDVVGLFGWIGSGGKVSNVGIVDSYTKGPYKVGGVCGYNDGGTITSCYNTGVVSGTGSTGGVCGYNYDKGTITSCYNTGAVSGSAGGIGGVCGFANLSNTIKNCYNTGAVRGSSYVGGVCGNHYNGTITSCYNIGAVSGSGIGSVCGQDKGTTKKCYYLEGTATGGINGKDVTGKAEKKDIDQFKGGEVAFLLQSSQTEENGIIPEVWGQMLTGETPDDYPVIGGNKVYQITSCVGYTIGYTNSENTAKGHTDDNSDSICDICNQEIRFNVEIVSSAEDSDVSSVANLNGGGNIKKGESTTITASAVPGYTFNGWYNGEEKLSADLSFVYEPTADVKLTAKYTANRTMHVTITSESENFNIAVNGGTSENHTTQQEKDYAVGTVLTLTANGDDFDYWENDIGSVVSRNATFDYTVVGNVSLTAVFNKKAENKATVTFVTAYDQIISRNQMTAEDTIEVPVTPVRYGYDFAGWSVNGGNAVAADKVVAEIQKVVAEVLETVDTADDVVMVRPVYILKEIDIIVTVYNGNAETGKECSYNVNDIVTVTAEDISGMKFAYWTDGEGKILSYNETYKFYATTNTTVKAVYVAEETVIEAKGTTEIVDIKSDAANGRIAFVSLSTVPEGCTIKVAGLIATTDEGVAKGTFDDTTADYVRGKSWSGTSYRYTWNKSAIPNQTWYVKAYLVYVDNNGNTHTVYGNTVGPAVLQ